MSASACLAAHATHPDAGMALALAAAQIDAQAAQRPGWRPTLGLLYLSEGFAERAAECLDEARRRWPGVAWAGAAAWGLAADGVEYLDEPALVLWLIDLPVAQFRCFDGRHPLAEDWAGSALVHADPELPELGALLNELAERTRSGYLFGGLPSARLHRRHWAGGEPMQGGLSGVAFAPAVGLVSRVTQGCQPVGPTRRVTGAERNLVATLDGQPALPQLLQDLQVSLDEPRQAMAALRHTLVGLTDEGDAARGPGGQFGGDTRVRHLIGIDPLREAVAVADQVEPGMSLAFCTRDPVAARRDLVRICAEIRDEVDGDGSAPPRRILGAHYVSCTGRGGPHFGGDSEELRILRHALGEVPLVGFFAAGEIAHRHLYGYTGVLTVFTSA
ncbi:FIST C-terminal domain-containing protein [Ideonella sp. 4Y16]|uniref:FIST signal transduction protein n=1 Tax=Ideonella alba TaxID=2824118 RepID=UPI001B390EFD|nr:FIST C-terminal domain-containing protein [Ideonella alba]MBQ0945365.1 FIST C-terminal domain-containing protein [Ideonella alba]